MADYVVDMVKTAVEDVPGVVSVTVDLVFEPIWDKSRMSEEAKVELGIDDDY
jgi:metal-sulfur cluster biosynthetic enzyme